MSKRKDPELAGRFQKNETAEAFLDKLNKQVADLNSQYRDTRPAGYSSIFILSAPRTGSTLLSQVLTQTLEIGYVSNLMAAFWRAPLVGLRLQKQVMDTNILPDFDSEFGRTRGSSGIHEFGYFWSEALRYAELFNSDSARTGEIDWTTLTADLAGIVNYAQQPFLHKNILVNWHAMEFARRLEKSIFVVIRRNLAEMVTSLLRMREGMLGTRDKWVSAKPAVYPILAERTTIEQVAGQVLALQAELNEQVRGLDPDRVIELEFEEFCQEPATAVNAVAQVLNRMGNDVTFRETELPAFQRRNSAASELAAAESALNAMRKLLAEKI